MIMRVLLPVILMILVAVQVVRSATVRSLAETAPASAAKAWPTHPDVVLSGGMMGIATAARESQAVSPELFAAIYGASIKAPLALEPFLVRGVQAQLSGNAALAQRAFLQARWRDGRSLPARYFLAEHYLRERDAAKGLREIAILARLVPDGVGKLAPYVARYASEPANQAQLRTVFRTEPALEDSSLAVLAGDARSADLVLSLSNPQRRNANSPWVAGLLASLTLDRQSAKARRIWADLSGVKLGADDLIYDPQFTQADAPPPFNWSLTSSSVGLAERQRGGGLHIIFYGQDGGSLASQQLALPAGTYRLTTKASGTDDAGSLNWTLVCVATNTPIATVPLDDAVRASWRFAIPASCPGQRLELGGAASDSAQQIDLVVQSVSLSPERPNG